MPKQARTFTHDGCTGTADEWAARLGIATATFYRRVQRGYTDRHLFAPGSIAYARKVTANGVTRTLQQWANATGLTPSTIANRLDAGVHPDEAVTRTPRHGAHMRPDDKRSDADAIARRRRDASIKRALDRVATIRAEEKARLDALDVHEPGDWRNQRDRRLARQGGGRVETSARGKGPAGEVTRNTAGKQDIANHVQ